MMKKIYYLSSSIVCAGFLFSITSARAELSCETVCQQDICGMSQRLADACIAECGTDPNINVCRMAANKAFPQSRRQKQGAAGNEIRKNRRQAQEAAGDEIRKQRAEKRRNNQQSVEEENMGVGSLFDDNEAGNNVSEPNENMNSGDSVATPRHAMHPPHRLDGQSHKRAVCVPPQVAIKKAMHILHTADSCTKAPVSSTDEKSDLQAPTLNAEGIPDAPPTPPVGRHQVRKGPLSNITSDALKAGRKGLRPVGERQAARRGPARDAAPAENAEQGTFHNSEGGNSFLDKLGQKVAGRVLQGANVR